MLILIDGHEDLANNILGMKRDYLISAHEARKLEQGSREVEAYGQRLLGWPEFQKGHVTIVFGTLFATPRKWQKHDWDPMTFDNPEEAFKLALRQMDVYHQLGNDQPHAFRLISDQTDLTTVLDDWQEGEDPKDRPVGIVPLMEGADGIRSMADLEIFRSHGLYFLGLVWAGNRFAGGTREPGPLTAEGRRLLAQMDELDLCLDVSHMSCRSLLQAVDHFRGQVIASHANCRALLPGTTSERNLTDEAIQELVKREAVIGLVPFNVFLDPGWQKHGPREHVRLNRLVEHIDHICQIAGDAHHVGIGSDFDGGFGLEDTPYEIDTVADLQKLAPLLREREYNDADVAAIFHGNWLRILRKVLPK
jgi:membrane dipeptidase